AGLEIRHRAFELAVDRVDQGRVVELGEPAGIDLQIVVEAVLALLAEILEPGDDLELDLVERFQVRGRLVSGRAGLAPLCELEFALEVERIDRREFQQRGLIRRAVGFERVEQSTKKRQGSRASADAPLFWLMREFRGFPEPEQAAPMRAPHER